MERENHPVWTVYDKLRTARLNVKYYGCRLRAIERTNFVLELVLLASAPSSAIAGLWFWQTPTGRLIWQYFGIVAAIAAVIKPLLGLTKKIKDFEGILAGYRGLEYDLSHLRTMVEQKQKFDSQLQQEFKKALARERILVGRIPETREITRVKDKCEREVLSELPSESFYIPEV